MTAQELIDKAATHSMMSKSSIAEALGWSRQLLFKRMKTGKFTIEELDQIAKAMGAECVEVTIVFPDGTIIGE